MIDVLYDTKTPGSNGIEAEFYKTKFNIVVAVILLPGYSLAYELRTLTLAFTRPFTALIPKSNNADKLKKVTGYRPITPCNIDYKILAKLLVPRFQGVARQLNREHQTCGIQGRSIVTNVHVARGVLEACDDGTGQVAMLQIDLVKASDCVKRSV